MARYAVTGRYTDQTHFVMRTTIQAESEASVLDIIEAKDAAGELRWNIDICDILEKASYEITPISPVDKNRTADTADPFEVARMLVSLDEVGSSGSGFTHADVVAKARAVLAAAAKE